MRGVWEAESRDPEETLAGSLGRDACEEEKDTCEEEEATSEVKPGSPHHTWSS